MYYRICKSFTGLENVDTIYRNLLLLHPSKDVGIRHKRPLSEHLIQSTSGYLLWVISAFFFSYLLTFICFWTFLIKLIFFLHVVVYESSWISSQMLKNRKNIKFIINRADKRNTFLFLKSTEWTKPKKIIRKVHSFQQHSSSKSEQQCLEVFQIALKLFFNIQLLKCGQLSCEV